MGLKLRIHFLMFKQPMRLIKMAALTLLLSRVAAVQEKTNAAMDCHYSFHTVDDHKLLVVLILACKHFAGRFDDLCLT